jgi:olefin beta-lactone synthetase
VSPLPPNANIARHLALMAAAHPATAALKIPRGRTSAGDIDYLTLTFAELAAEVAAWQSRLTSAGILPGDRTLVMVRPGLPLIASVFALFALGAVPVVIDPGMGLSHFLACVAHSRPRALIGIPFARFLSHVRRRAFTTIEIRVPASNSLTARLTKPKTQNPKPPTIVNSRAADLAAVLFTSGSTGAPKGVCYEHGHFDAQVRLIRDTYNITPGEIDLPLLPIFALFNPALGLTTIIPELDPRRPATLDPAKIVQAIRQENVTNSFGSPTLWKKIGDHCIAEAITLPTLRRVLCAGAPVPASLWENSRTFLPNGQLHSPYGATEALPVATISSAEIHALHNAPPETCNLLGYKTGFPRGACVGRAVQGIAIKIIAPVDHPLATLASAVELPPGEIGEIIVCGPVVTRHYDALPEATALAKLETQNPKPKTDDAPAGVWHRMGDCGYLDADGRLWFCGRKAERVETARGMLYTEPCEQVFRPHPGIARCALIGLGPRGQQEPALVVELTSPSASADKNRLARELRALATQHALTVDIKKYFFQPRFPVDVRHNAKIHRLTLAQWAATASSFSGDLKS